MEDDKSERQATTKEAAKIMPPKKYIRLIWILILSPLNIAIAQEKLIFSAVEETIPAKITKHILTEAYRKIGISIEIRELPGARGLFCSNTAQTDGEAFRIAGIEKDYPNLCRIEVPVTSNSLYVVVKKGREFPVNGWESIPENYRVGYQRGVRITEKSLRKNQIKTEAARHISQLLNMLEFDRVDAIIEGEQHGQNTEELERRNMVQLKPAIHLHPLYHYLHVKHADLIPEITAALQEMKTSGELQKIQEDVIAALLQEKRSPSSEK